MQSFLKKKRLLKIFLNAFFSFVLTSPKSEKFWGIFPHEKKFIDRLCSFPTMLYSNLFIGWLSLTWFSLLGTSLMLPNLRLWLLLLGGFAAADVMPYKTGSWAREASLSSSVTDSIPWAPLPAAFEGCCPPCPFCRTPCPAEVAVLLTQVRDWVCKILAIRETKSTSRFFISFSCFYFKGKNPNHPKLVLFFLKGSSH